MKLLLTSGGLTNAAIADALFELVGKLPKETTLAFIPTAANVEEGDKGWLIDDLWRLQEQGFQWIDIVDISALSREQWQPRIEKADVIFVGGGNTFHLLHWMHTSGLAAMLPKLLKTRVYAGISAGSMVTGSVIKSSANRLYYEKEGNDDRALGFVPFCFIPHLNAPFFPNVTAEYIKEIAQDISEPIEALDDQSALKIVDGKIEHVGTGQLVVLNGK